MEEEKLGFSSDFLNSTSEDINPEDFNLTNYLFEPDITKLKDISEFDVETDWIPRISRFGDFTGDGILASRLKITKVVFHGFYEDLTEKSQVEHLSENELSFNRIQDESVFLKDVEKPVHVICYNADVLLTEDGKNIRNSDCWITPLLDVADYSLQDKFVLQCFELIRLTRVSQRIADRIKVLSILSSSQIPLTEENYRVLAGCLFHFVENLDQEFEHQIDRIEWPIYYGILKKDLSENRTLFEKIVHSKDYVKYAKFQKSLDEILEGKTDHLQIELNNYLDTFYGKKVFSEYITLLGNLSDDFFKLYIFGELVVGLSRVLPGQVLEFYFVFGQKLIQKESIKLQLIEDLRFMLIKKSLLLYDDFIWGPSLLFNILGFYTNSNSKKHEGLSFLIKSNNYLQNPRDHIQFLFTYLEVLKVFRKLNYGYEIVSRTVSYLKNQFLSNENLSFTFNEYIFLSRYSLSLKIQLNLDTKENISFIMTYLLKEMRKRAPIVSLSNEEVDSAITFFRAFDFDFNDEELKMIINTNSGDLYIALYNLELIREKPNIKILIQISILFLRATKNMKIYSMIFPTPMDYSQDRLKFYFNLFIFYNLQDKKGEYTQLGKMFISEFADKIDSNVLIEIENALFSEETLENFIISNTHLMDYDIDKSLVFYLKLKRLISNYLETEDLNSLVKRLEDLLNLTENYENYNPHYSTLKLLYRLMIRSENNFNTLNSIKTKILSLRATFNISDRIALSSISDSELQEIFIPNQVVKLLSPLT